jgi:two-component system sensor histidine kinase CreC
MIDKLLALASVEHRQRLDEPESLEPADLAADVADQVAPRLESAGQRLRVDLAPGLPALRGDAFLLRQALANLVENAADFSPRGAAIELQVAREGERLRFEVADRGPGIPDYALPRVFERFYSLPRPEGGSRSSGIGLCFVAEVAALHGGSAGLHNRDGGGAVAHLALPAA